MFTCHGLTQKLLHTETPDFSDETGRVSNDRCRQPLIGYLFYHNRTAAASTTFHELAFECGRLSSNPATFCIGDPDDA